MCAAEPLLRLLNVLLNTEHVGVHSPKANCSCLYCAQGNVRLTRSLSPAVLGRLKGSWTFCLVAAVGGRWKSIPGEPELPGRNPNDAAALADTIPAWECKYHVVFIPKYRKKAIFGVIKKRLGDVFHELARRRESKIKKAI